MTTRRTKTTAALIAAACIMTAMLAPTVTAAPGDIIKGCAWVNHNSLLTARSNFVKVSTDTSDNDPQPRCTDKPHATWSGPVETLTPLNCEVRVDATGPPAPQFIAIAMIPWNADWSVTPSDVSAPADAAYYVTFSGATAATECDVASNLGPIIDVVNEWRILFRICDDATCTVGPASSGYDVTSFNFGGNPGGNHQVSDWTEGYALSGGTSGENDPISCNTGAEYSPGDTVRVVVTSRRLDGSALNGVGASILANVTDGNITRTTDLPVTSLADGGAYEFWYHIPSDALLWREWKVHVRYTADLVYPGQCAFRVVANLTAMLGERFDTVDTATGGLAADHDALGVEHAGLTLAHSGLTTDHDGLSADHGGLSADHATITGDIEAFNDVTLTTSVDTYVPFMIWGTLLLFALWFNAWLPAVAALMALGATVTPVPETYKPVGAMILLNATCWSVHSLIRNGIIPKPFGKSNTEVR